MILNSALQWSGGGFSKSGSSAEKDERRVQARYHDHIKTTIIIISINNIIIFNIVIIIVIVIVIYIVIIIIIKGS